MHRNRAAQPRQGGHRDRGAPPAGGGRRQRAREDPGGRLFGDNTSPANSQAFTDQLKALGDDASTILLPDAGLHGNGHTMMLERNNEQIADLIERWINQQVPHVRGRSHR